jgi:hypothetical protein
MTHRAPTDTITCARCGHTYTRGGGTPIPYACADCRLADPFGTARILGQQPPPPRGNPARRVPPERDTWPDTDLRRAAANYKAGMRDTWTIERSREYQRRQSQRARAAKREASVNCRDPWACRDPCDGCCAMSPYGALSDTTPLHPNDEAARCGNTQRPLTSQSAATGTEAHVSIPTSAGADQAVRPYKPQAIQLLIASREALERAKVGRLRVVSMARQHGLTNREIGEALGVDESAVRHMLKRAGEAA